MSQSLKAHVVDDTRYNCHRPGADERPLHHRLPGLRIIQACAARPVRAYLERAGIGDDKEGPLFRPLSPDGTGVVRRHLDRKTPSIDPSRLRGCGIGIHSLRKTAINDAIRKGAGGRGAADLHSRHVDARAREVTTPPFAADRLMIHKEIRDKIPLRCPSREEESWNLPLQRGPR